MSITNFIFIYTILIICLNKLNLTTEIVTIQPNNKNHVSRLLCDVELIVKKLEH